MKNTMAYGLALACAVSSTARPIAAQERPGGGLKRAGCSAMDSLRLPDVRITEAVAVAAVAAAGGTIKMAHCKVSGGIGRRRTDSVW